MNFTIRHSPLTNIEGRCHVQLPSPHSLNRLLFVVILRSSMVTPFRMSREASECWRLSILSWFVVKWMRWVTTDPPRMRPGCSPSTLDKTGNQDDIATGAIRARDWPPYWGPCNSCSSTNGQKVTSAAGAEIHPKVINWLSRLDGKNKRSRERDSVLVSGSVPFLWLSQYLHLGLPRVPMTSMIEDCCP
jgi:hypothetical protein